MLAVAMIADAPSSDLDGAGWLDALAALTGPETAALVQSALGSARERSDTLGTRLAFGKLSQVLRPTGLAHPEALARLPELAASGPWLEDEMGRVAFLVALSEQRPPAEFVDTLTTLYRTGSDREQISILRALPFLPDQGNLVPLAREASRTNDVAVFRALACQSAFPARHLPDPAFEQLVLKALFVGVPLDEILNLDSRVTPELKRMVADFADERRAAGRPVPTDVPRLLAIGWSGSV